MDLRDGRYDLLTDGRTRHESAAVAHSGKHVAYSGNGRNGRDMDIYLRDLRDPDPGTIIWEVEGSFYPQEFSPDDGRLLVMQYISERETRVHVLDIASGRKQQLTPRDPPQYYSGGKWSNDGQAVYIASDRQGEFRKLYRVGLDSGDWTCLTPDINWDIEEVAVDPAGGIAFVANQDGVSALYLADANGRNRRQITAVPPGVIGGLSFNRGGGVLGFTLDMATSPGDAYTVNARDASLTRWTQSEVGGLDPARFVEPQLIRYPTFDQVDGKPRMIAAFVFKGRGDGPRPVVIQPHGGPESQYQPIFSSTFQFWAVELGITVISPNVRGSTGYGRSFHLLDNDVKREDSVRDIGALLDWIAAQPDMDSKRVGIFGGSYGGYMVLASLANYPDRFKAGIDIVGIASFVSFLERTSEYRRDLRRAEYGDERIPEVRRVLDQIAPLNNAEKIRAALFVLHGQNDPRVPLHEAQQIVEKMRALNRPVWFANALDEGHGFAKKPNRDLANVLYAAFWQEHLLK
jgi:dipeptidyl aminopeptidase/acylaminoacyl peptidase